MGEFITNNFEYIVVTLGVLIVLGIFDLNSQVKAIREQLGRIQVVMDAD